MYIYIHMYIHTVGGVSNTQVSFLGWLYIACQKRNRSQDKRDLYHMSRKTHQTFRKRSTYRCVYIHLCMCIYIHVYTYMSVDTLRIRTHPCMYMYIYIYTYI